jgi:CopG family transcriptional regulator, nickel-responsive regulator
MQRVTFSLDEDIAVDFDDLVRAQGYQSRSEAVRDLIRREVDSSRLQQTGDNLCVANLSYVYDHHTRALAGRLVALQHAHHELVVSTTHVHLDHDNCLESTILKGPIDAVRSLTDSIKAERGVHFATTNLVSMP